MESPQTEAILGIFTVAVFSEGRVAVFYIYADDSGKLENQRNRYTTLCGYVAHASEWERFSLEWNNCRFRWGVPPVHMSPIMYPDRDAEWLQIQAQWGQNWARKRELMLEDFAATVRNAHLVCVGAVVDAAHYRSLANTEFKRGTSPLGFAFHQLVMRGIEKTEIIDSHSPISLVIDDDRESSMKCYEMLNNLKQTFPKVRDRIRGISFVDDKCYPGIQASDMIAYESRLFMEARAKDPDAKPSELFGSLTMLGIHLPLLYTPQILDQLEHNTLEELKK